MTNFMVSMMAASALGGRVAEKIGVRVTCVTGSLVSVAGLYCLSLLTPGKDDWHIIGGLILGGVGLGLANGPSQSAALVTIDPAQSRTDSGILSSCRYLGAALEFQFSGCCYPRPILRNLSRNIIRRSSCLPGRSALRKWFRYCCPGG